ncbi:MAG: hypothetical protein KDJ52_05340 [Anaerolineae bacterium]|nr:hypothetical protein [Anaerolineae bacterium]
MAGLLKRFRVAIAVLLSILALMVVISACNQIRIGGFGDNNVDEAATSKIIAPVESGTNEVAHVFVGSPVQILSTHAVANISRVELSVQPDGGADQLIRADVPTNGTITQGWTPDAPGAYTVTAAAYDTNGTRQTGLSIRVEASSPDGIVAIPQGEFAAQTAAFQGSTPTPTANVIIARPTEIRATPVAQSAGNAAFQAPDAEIVVVDSEAATTLISTKPVTVTYPPPPPAPGVPWGPTQDQLPLKIPPVCDAAEFVAVYADSTAVNASTYEGSVSNRREFIPGPDDIPKKVAGGTIVHRAWKLRNIGTCTWGPGYELAFYGGRSMGSGGVAFESTFPSDLRPRNQLIDTNRLILPEGKPNQIAVLEVLLNVPSYPGIHQSYWRMRNPQGVYFGPIIGVTMDVVRDCNQPELGVSNRIYGAPSVTFRILGVDGNLVGDDEGTPGSGPLPATVGQLLNIDWNVFNITSFQLIIENPTGDIEVITTTDPRDRANFTPTIVGDYILTLFAENGACYIEQQIIVRVSPPTDEQFVLQATFNTNAPISALAGNIGFSSSVAPGSAKVEYEYFEDSASVQTAVTVESYEANWVAPSPCPIITSINCGGGYYTAWQRTNNLPLEIEGASASGSATIATSQFASGGLPDEIEAESGSQQPLSIAVPPPGCRGMSTSNKLYGVKYIGTTTDSNRNIVSDNVTFLCAASGFVPNDTVPQIP